MKQKQGIGIKVTLSEKKMKELSEELAKNKIKIRGRVFIGKIVSKDTHKTAKIEWSRKHLIPKYERFENRTSKIKAHNPDCLDYQVGDLVKAVECRPISITINFVIIDILN